MVGYEDWSQKTFEVMQYGSQSWTGQVKVWKDESGAHGRRDPKDGAADGQWKTGDTIKHYPGIHEFNVIYTNPITIKYYWWIFERYFILLCKCQTI